MHSQFWIQWELHQILGMTIPTIKYQPRKLPSDSSDTDGNTRCILPQSIVRLDWEITTGAIKTLWRSVQSSAGRKRNHYARCSNTFCRMYWAGPATEDTPLIGLFKNSPHTIALNVMVPDSLGSKGIRGTSTQRRDEAWNSNPWFIGDVIIQIPVDLGRAGPLATSLQVWAYLMAILDPIELVPAQAYTAILQWWWDGSLGNNHKLTEKGANSEQITSRIYTFFPWVQSIW